MSPSIAIILHAVLFVVLLGVFRLIFASIGRRISLGGSYRRFAFRAAPVVLAALPFGGFAAGLLWQNLAPAGVQFQGVFGQSADGIEDLLAHSDAVSDAREVFLRFRAPERTVKTLIGQDFGLFTGNPVEKDWLPMPSADPPPPWWTATSCPNPAVYTAASVRGWDHIVLTHCPDDGSVFVQARWTH